MSKQISAYWLKSGAYTLMEKALLTLFRFASFYLLVRALDKESFGIWTLFLIICAMIEVARIGMIQTALVKFLTGTDEHKIRARINTASLSLHFLLTIFLVLLIAVSTRFMVRVFGLPMLEDLFYLYLFTCVALIPLFQFQFIQQANFDFRGIFYSNLTRHGLFLAFILMSYYGSVWHINLRNLAIVQIISVSIASVVAYFFGRKYYAFSKRLDRWWFRWLFNYGKYVIGTSIASMFIKSIDQLMLGLMLSPIAVAIYSTAIKISNLVEVPTQTIATIVFPKSAKRVEKEGKESLKHLYEKSVGVLIAMVFPIVILVWIFSQEIIVIIAGEAYLEAAPILRITMIFGLFVPFARQFGTMMDAMGNPRINFRLVILSAILNLLFNYLFIQEWGVTGAAYATLLTFAILFVANQIILYRKLNVLPLRVFVYAGRSYITGIRLIQARLAGKGVIS